MSIIRTVDVLGIQNAERYFNDEVFKPVGKHDLISVTQNGNELILEFEDEENPTAKNFVKQLSKKKHPNLDSFYANAPDSWRLAKNIELAKIYLFFFSEKYREKEYIIW